MFLRSKKLKQIKEDIKDIYKKLKKQDEIITFIKNSDSDNEQTQLEIDTIINKMNKLIDLYDVENNLEKKVKTLEYELEVTNNNLQLILVEYNNNNIFYKTVEKLLNFINSLF